MASNTRTHQIVVDDHIGMVEAAAQRYLRWLGKQVRPDRDIEYDDLYAILHSKEFVWIVPNDDNRISDGMDIRDNFFSKRGVLLQGCSVLEVIIGLSRRLAFLADGEPEIWAWTLICNLELRRMSGHIGETRSDAIEEILERFIWRTYDSDGTGGLFPLANPITDQRRIELWYQMCAYVNEIPDT